MDAKMCFCNEKTKHLPITGFLEHLRSDLENIIDLLSMDRWLKSGSLKKTIKTSATVPPVAMEASKANSVEEDGAVANARISGQDEGFLDESATAEEFHDKIKENCWVVNPYSAVSEKPACLTSHQNKEFRLNAIKTQILSYLGLLGKEPVINTSASNPQQMEIMRTMYERMQQSPQWPLSDTYTEKVQSFYPSFAMLKGDYKTTGETCATLALSELAQTSTEDFQQDNGQTKSQYMSTLPVTPTYKDEKQVRVSVYWYTRSLKKNRVKRKLLDSRMVSIYGEEWLEFNVKSAARVWRESGKNFGLSIQVEDEDNQVLPAVKYFSFMDCSNEAFIATARPIPGFLVNAARDYILESTRNETNTRRSNTIYLDSLMFPMIDLFTIEMPEHEMVDAALLYQTRSPSRGADKRGRSKEEEEKRERENVGGGSDKEEDDQLAKMVPTEEAEPPQKEKEKLKTAEEGLAEDFSFTGLLMELKRKSRISVADLNSLLGSYKEVTEALAYAKGQVSVLEKEVIRLRERNEQLLKEEGRKELGQAPTYAAKVGMVGRRKSPSRRRKDRMRAKCYRSLVREKRTTATQTEDRAEEKEEERELGVGVRR
uniref:(California timema) hypothetical protein n=1 Tax=Timema californicum TaxID=61474 RepID=A0A7R9J2F3_TIMCA|nr:unnamed protein product [Timema californicum]